MQCGMRVIVIGAGEVGQNIARTLSAERHDVTIVDQDEARVEAIQGQLDALALAGNGASPKFLRELRAGEADLVCAVTQRDEVNVIAALTARQLGAQHTVARVRDDDYFGGDEAFSRDMLGIDFVIHPERATAEDLAEAVALPGAVHVEHFADGRLSVAESVLTERSPLIGRALRERKMVRPHAVVGLIRDGRTLAAEPGQRPKRGDHVLIAAAREDIGATVAYIAGQTAEVHDVVIFGAGRIGLPLARQLETADRFHVTVIERDAERARVVAELLGGSIVLHEDGMSKDALLAHGVDRADAFVACAGDDRSNLLTALHAKQIGADFCLAVVSREDFVPLVDALGIDAAFSPRLVTAETILQSVRGENVHAMHLLLGGAEVIEVEADFGCRADGRTVEQVDSLSWGHVAAIVRDGKVLMPDPAERIKAGDRVVVFSPRRGVADVDRVFNAA
jgi:trk system potassium uptake protein TrkA